MSGSVLAAGALPMPDLGASFPGPFAGSPHADAVEEHAVAWLGVHPLLRSPRALRTLCNITAQGVSRTFPTAGPAELCLTADLFLWLTAFDDVHGEAEGARDPALLVRRTAEFVPLLAGAGGPGAGADPFTVALGDLLGRLAERADAERYARLTSHLRDSLFGILWEAHHLGDRAAVGLDDYLAMRPYGVFVRTVMASAEIVLGHRLSDEERALPALHEAEAAVADLAGWINDLASYAREAAGGGPPPLSLPTLLAREHGCDLAGAFALASRMCEERAATARARIDELTAGPDGALATHARALESIAHSYVWHIGHARYGG
jgi:hypothetical protein